MPIDDLKGQIGRLPEQPGVYLFLGRGDETLYVGKARILRDRVRSYLGAWGTSPRHDALLGEVDRLEVVVTDSVVEALALENHLIKQRMPRYNILLRDDKNYPYLQLTVTESCPRVLVARRVERDGNVYAGPFMPASLARRTMRLTHRLFGMRSCNEEITGRRDRPCLEFDIGRCVAPCVDAVCPPAHYARAVDRTRLFLEGKNTELIRDLDAAMRDAAEAERFEQAAHLRDAIRTIETLRDRQQKMATTTLGDRDAFGAKIGPSGSVIQVFQMRRGRVIERVELIADADQGLERGEADIIQAAVEQFYQAREVPPEVHVPVVLDEADLLEAWLTARAGQRVDLVVPRRGEKRGLLDLATRNAEIAYQTKFGGGSTAHYDALEQLRAVLGLPSFPRRIECFDISTLQGRDAVASMVVCEDGLMRKGEYRKFRVRGVGLASASSTGTADAIRTDTGTCAGADRPTDAGTETGTDTRTDTRPDAGAGADAGGGHPGPEASRQTGTHADGEQASAACVPHPQVPRTDRRGSASDLVLADDFAAMREVVLRRYRRTLALGGPFPDLVLIDGGKGQLSAAYEALQAVGLANLVAVGLAKKEELVVTRDRPESVAFARDNPALLLLQRIRDEAHRFAVTFHRQARRQRDFTSELDAIAGIGVRRRRLLLETFGSVAGVRRASREALAAVVGAKAAGAVLAHFAHTSP